MALGAAAERKRCATVLLEMLQWWPGVVGTPVREADDDVRRSEEGQIVYTVEYEDYQEFAAESCQVSFLNERTQHSPGVGSSNHKQIIVLNCSFYRRNC